MPRSTRHAAPARLGIIHLVATPRARALILVTGNVAELARSEGV